MKFTNVGLWLMVGVAVLIMTACNSGLAAMEPQIIVVTATPTATPEVVIDDPAPTEEVRVGGGAEPEAEPTAVVYEPGTLLKGSGDGVFYLRDDGARQHIYDWATFVAFGFEQENIVEVDDTVLEAIPLSSELTRLVRAENDNLYWIADSQRWKVNEWDSVVSTEGYNGLLVTPMDSSLQATFPGYIRLKDGILLREDEVVYYLNKGYRSRNIIPAPAGSYDEADVLDVPDGVLSIYTQKSYLDNVGVSLSYDTQAANIRSGSSLEHDVLDIVHRYEKIAATGRSADGAWLKVNYDFGRTGWLAADLVKPSVALNLLPVDDQIVQEKAFSEAQPAAVTEIAAPTELQPLYCDTTPIRGFGKVWGDHLDVQNTLGCPWGAEAGTDAAIQHFQHGIMLWLESDSRYNADPVYVFFNDGNYQRFGDLGAADPAKVGETPAGFHPVGDKFSKVYWEGTGVKVKERLGYATGEAEDTAGAFLQFNRGRMFWAEAIDSIFVIYDYYECCDANDNSYRIRSWASYEDKF